MGNKGDVADLGCLVFFHALKNLSGCKFFELCLAVNWGINDVSTLFKNVKRHCIDFRRKWAVGQMG